MSKLEDAFKATESLDPDDRLRLIARLWASLPEDYWAAPGAVDRADVRAMLARDDTDQMANLPYKIARQVVGMPPAPPGAKIYSAPRRFDLATIFVVTFAYSLLFALLSGFRSPPQVSLIVGSFITIVGISQAVLFKGRMPRAASFISGTVACFVCIVILPLIGRFDIGGTSELIAFALVFSMFLGGILGYCAGALVGGVFLIADVVRQWFVGRAEASQEDVVELTANDAD